MSRSRPVTPAVWSPALTGLRFPEGPAVRSGMISCVDVDDAAVHCVREGAHERLAVGGRPNGAVFGDAGNLILADSGRNAMVCLDLTTRSLSTVWKTGLRGPNDLLVEGDTVTFTDPGASTAGDRFGRILRVAQGQAKTLADGLAFPNGLARQDDGGLVVAETKTGRLLLLKDGTASAVADGLNNPDSTGGPDGLAFLPDGAFAVAVYGAGHIAILELDFTHRGTLPTPGQRPTNVCHDGETLYCTEVDTGTLWRCPLPPFEAAP